MKNKHKIYDSKSITSCVLLILILSVISCNKEEKTTIPEVNNLLGKWNWISSISGLHGTILTPQSEGYNMSIEFKLTGMIEFRKNDTITSEKQFSIIHDAGISSLPIIKLENDPLWMYSIIRDTLFLNNICTNCFNEKYLRAR